MSLFAFQDIITGLCGIMVFIVLVQVVDMASCKGAGTGREPVAQANANEELRREVSALEKKLERLKSKSSKAVVAAKGVADSGNAGELGAELSEKERETAAIVSQVHELETQLELTRDANERDSAKLREMERTRRQLERQISALNGKGITLIAERGSLKIPVYMVCSGSGIEIHRPFEDFRKESISAHDLHAGLVRFLERLDHTTHQVVLLVRPSGIEQMYRAVDALSAQNFVYGRDPLEESAEIAFSVKGEK